MKIGLGFLMALCLFLVPLASFPSSSAHAQEAFSLEEIIGSYRVRGRNPDGSSYRGTAVIQDNLGSAEMRWRVGGRAYQGVGKIVGREFVVDWGSQYPVIYTMDVDGTLVGSWANGAASEVLTRR